jgi:hypothetical protein
MTKFQEFIQKYGHNKFVVLYSADKGFLEYFLKNTDESLLFIVWYPPLDFPHERIFHGQAIADTFKEIEDYFWGAYEPEHT